MPIDPQSLYDHTTGEIHFSAHFDHFVGWILASSFTLIAVVTSLWLTLKHLGSFTSPLQQRHVVRILFMVPIYSCTSLLSSIEYTHALYWQLGRDCYEAFVIASFFQLLLAYLSCPIGSYPSEKERRENLRVLMRDVEVGKWIFPFGSVKWRPGTAQKGTEGPAFLWYMRLGVMQYTIIRPVSTLVSIAGEATNQYCLNSWSPRFFHIWTTVAISISVSIAMYCVLQLWNTLKTPLAPYSPMLKFLAVKSVVFLTFWQEAFLGLLVTFGAIKARTYYSAAEISNGLAAILSCFEMMVFAFLHLKAFTYRPYVRRIGASRPEPSRWSALKQVLDVRDVFREIWAGRSSFSSLLSRNLTTNPSSTSRIPLQGSRSTTRRAAIEARAGFRGGHRQRSSRKAVCRSSSGRHRHST